MADHTETEKRLLRSPGRLSEIVTIPDGLRPILEKGFEKFRTPSESRPQTVEQRVEARRVAADEVWESDNPKCPVPRLREEVTDELVEATSLRLRTGQRFIEMADSAGWLEQPILLYYGFSQLIDGVTCAIFEWEEDDLKGHGMSHSGPDGDGDIQLWPEGLFPRFVATNTLMTGTPSGFSRLIVVSDGDSFRRTNRMKSRWNVEELLNVFELEYEQNCYEVTAKFLPCSEDYDEFHGQRVGRHTRIGADLLLLYVASSLARYYPSNWLAEREKVAKLAWEDVFARCSAIGFAHLRYLQAKSGLPNETGPYAAAAHR